LRGEGATSSARLCLPLVALMGINQCGNGEDKVVAAHLDGAGADQLCAWLAGDGT